MRVLARGLSWQQLLGESKVANIAELQRDWREATGEGLGQVMGEHLNFYGNLIGGYLAAKA